MIIFRFHHKNTLANSMPQVILSFDLSIAAASSRLIICSIADFTTSYTGLYGVNLDSKLKVCTQWGRLSERWQFSSFFVYPIV